MKKKWSLLCVVLLTLAFSVPVTAGDMPSGGYCDSPQCTSDSPAPTGFMWVLLDGLWYLSSIV